MQFEKSYFKIVPHAYNVINWGRLPSVIRAYAMVTNHLRAPSISSSQFFTHCMIPGEVLLRVIEGRLTSTRHHTLPRRRLHTSDRQCVFAEVHYFIYIDTLYFTSEDQKYKIYISLQQLRINNTQSTRGFEMFAVLSKCCFYLHHSQSQPQSL